MDDKTWKRNMSVSSCI